MTEAAAQGHVNAQYILGVTYQEGHGVTRDLDRAVELYTQVAEQGYVDAYINLGSLLRNERKDVDGAEKAYRAAIEADPRYANAHNNLAYLLLTEHLSLIHI